MAVPENDLLGDCLDIERRDQVADLQADLLLANGKNKMHLSDRLRDINKLKNRMSKSTADSSDIQAIEVNANDVEVGSAREKAVLFDSVLSQPDL